MTEKSILEQALLQVQTLEEAVKQNAKGILASTMKQELNDLLKESLEEEEKLDPMGEQPEDETKPDEEEDDMSDDDATADDAEAVDFFRRSMKPLRESFSTVCACMYIV